MDYNFKKIEKDWQGFWAAHKTFKAETHSEKPKCYVLDMFPYPSGAGLHVGHPLGYIASDIYSRYKRLKGFNVLHPMGYDSFGLPAEQYAIQTGQHPAVTTENNIARYREQLDNIGFSFDWDREVRTSDPRYYKWTQWIFIQLFNSWYNTDSDKAESIAVLIEKFKQEGNKNINACADEAEIFSADEWNQKSEEQQQKILLNYRLAYLADSWVNWCPALGTVLANDEVKDGVSERGGYPVEQKLMKQWSMRITAYAERLLQGLDTIDWPDPIKEMQRNWIGKSEGALVNFGFRISDFGFIEVFTTRPDTIFGVSFVTLAPEHELVDQITTFEYKDAVDAYKKMAAAKSERDRMSDVKTISGQFTGAYVEHPFTGKPVPVWIGDYVLATYGTGAVMAVPAHDTRDYAFAKHFSLPIIEVIQPVSGLGDESGAYDLKEGVMINSDFLNGLDVKVAIKKAIEKIEEKNIGKGKINYRLRDAIFGRQRYWGEPIPVYYKNNIPYVMEEKDLPLTLPEVDKFLPTEDGEPPLARAKDWNYRPNRLPVTDDRSPVKVAWNVLNDEAYPLETTTMPGWAGSSWYFFRYMDPHNEEQFASKKEIDYWQNVDLYIGGQEHATGHLLYARFWNKFLKDAGYVNVDEPFRKLINQGMIQGRSAFVYRVNGTNTYVSYDLKDQYDTIALHVDVNFVENDILDTEKFRVSNPDYKNAEFILSSGKYICGSEVEKMSKSKYNVVNPDDIVDRYGADTLRMYEMFLGPLEQSKPWNTNGIEGVFKFLRKFWKLFHDDQFNFVVSEEEPTKAELKALHTIIKKVEEDVDRFSFNTSVSSFMICVNTLTDLKCNKRKILQDLVIVLSPYAPHISEELWKLLGNKEGTLSYATYPKFNPDYLVEDDFAYPISINGKTKMNLNLPLTLEPADIEKEVLASADVQKYLDGKTPKKVIVVKGRIVNIVV
jgi:leucyl-tRNA synthetase